MEWNDMEWNAMKLNELIDGNEMEKNNNNKWNYLK